jgi:hypothetical protein
MIRAVGGLSGSPPYGRGGDGRVKLEDIDGAIGGLNLVLPNPTVSTFTPTSSGRTVAQSLFYDTLLLNPVFTFDGTDPNTGLATRSTADLLFALEPAAGQTVKIGFQGAPANPANPSEPDPDTTRWVPPQASPTAGVVFATDVATLGGRNLRFLRFRVEFNIGLVPPGQPFPPKVSIQALRVRIDPAP